MVTALVMVILLSTEPVLAQQAPAQPGRNSIVPPSWRPSLDDSIDWLDAQQATQNSPPQSVLNRFARAQAELRDAQLFVIYIQLMQVLDPLGRARLLREQEEWLNRRSRQAAAAVVSRGGTMAPAEYNAEYTRLTADRERELRRRLQGLGKTGP
jgi:uncharacterized protein YecT (DUF1311 family)